MTDAEQPTFPIGSDFLKVLVQAEDQCANFTHHSLTGMGEMPLQLVPRLGTVLSLLDRVASCHWGCSLGDHVVEYLCGRSVSNGRAALRLATFGLYDESLSLTRSIGEIANLLLLFVNSPPDLAAWKAMSRGDRINKYGPGAVRAKLPKFGAPIVPVSEQRYRLLCERATHVTPETRPQAHNVLGLPSTGGNFQIAGFLLCLNELAVPIAIVSYCAAKILPLKNEVALEMLHAGRDVIEMTGAITIESIDDFFQNARNDLGKNQPEDHAR